MACTAMLVYQLLALLVLCELCWTIGTPVPVQVSVDSRRPAGTEFDANCASGDSSSGGKQCDSGDKPNVHVVRIVHATSAIAAIADGSLAQVPGLGTMVVVPAIQAAMVAFIGRHYGCYLDHGHALALVTLLASDHAKKAMFREIIGYIPLAGNLVKAGLTAFMTEGIGNLADQMLRCPTGSDNLLNSVNSADVPRAGSAAKHVFHIVSDYLGGMDLTSVNPLAAVNPKASAEEAWRRVRQLFSVQSQAQLLANIEEAPSADVLSKIIMEHMWNLEVVAAALGTLTQRFADERQQCIVVDFVGTTFWRPLRSNVEAMTLTAPYLNTCLPYASSDTRRFVASASAKLLIDTRGGSKGGFEPLMVQQALDLLAITAEESKRGEDIAYDVTVDESLQSQDLSPASEPALPMSDILSAYSAATIALQSNYGAACRALRALLRAESSGLRAANKTGSVAASVRQLEMLGRMEPPPGAETCLPSMRADLESLLTLGVPPSTLEGASDVAPHEAGFRGGGQLEDILTRSVVGQHCVVKRIARSPGYGRLRMRGIWDNKKPLVLLLTGPSGTGKTLMARTLAEALLGKPIVELEASGKFRTFHMNQFSSVEDQKSFFGPPKGIVGTGDLPELLKQWPDAVILLDEVEKAHPTFARALLKVLGENGAAYDPHTGMDVPSSGATFLLTSNLAKDLIQEQATSLLASNDVDPDCTAYEALHEDVMTALRHPFVRGRENFFKESEIRGRLTDVLPFMPFGRVEVEYAVRRFLAAESFAFQKKPEFLHASLSWEPEVVSYLSSEYFRRHEEGLRGVQTQLQAKVREVFECAIESKLLKKFGEVVLWVRPDKTRTLDLRVVPLLSSAERGNSLTSHQSASSFEQPWADWLFTRRKDDILKPSSWPVGSGSSIYDESTEQQWDRMYDWDLEFCWQQLRQFIFDYWPAFAIVGVALLGVAAAAPWSAAAATPMAAPMFAPAPVAATAPLAANGIAVAAPLLSGLIGCFVTAAQLAVPVGSTAVTFWTACYIWENRFFIMATTIAGGFVSLLVPILLKYLWRKACLRLVGTYEHSSQSPVRQRSSRHHGSRKARRSRDERSQAADTCLLLPSSIVPRVQTVVKLPSFREQAAPREVSRDFGESAILEACQLAGDEIR